MGYRGKAWLVFVLAGIGLALSPAVAQAATTRSATATGSGATQASAATSAENAARSALATLASQLGEVCWDVTTTSTLIYVVPSGGGYAFSATATGQCGPTAPPSPYTVPHTVTVQAMGGSPAEAVRNGENAAKAGMLADYGDCVNWSTTSTYVYSTPYNQWIYNVTVSALCIR